MLRRERSPKGLVTSLHPKLGGKDQPIGNVDPCELLHSITNATRGDISGDDFMPMSHAKIFEPLLPLVGYGHYRLSAPSFCGFFTLLTNTASQKS